MSLQYNNALVLRADVRNMLFRKCGKCKSKLIGEFSASYNLALLVQIDWTLQYFHAHELALVPLLGCEPKQFCELVQNNPHILDVVRERFEGFPCHLILRQPKGDKGSSSSMKKPKKSQKKSSENQVLEAIIPADPLHMQPFLHRYLVDDPTRE
ncbi:hypothetical protein BX666DRAFT_2023777 [Dichotomocladium elegans]|nr:hypothetical protein BX666DRAFT_2023777 [Dichotomocladium elegans]